MRFLSCFAGIGGIDKGLEDAGWTCVGQVEIDPFCQRVLAKHWPDVWRHDDITTLASRDVPQCDAIVAGFPCQQLSVAGKGEGLGTKENPTERSGLWWTLYRLIDEIRPRVVLLENVPALRGRGADAVLGALEESGYACWPLVVGARHVGAPHRRDRVWIVAHRSVARLAQRRGLPVGAGAEEPVLACGGDACDVAHGAMRRRDGEPASIEGRSSPQGSRSRGREFPAGGERRDVAHGRGREGERLGGLLDGERAALGHDADRRYRWPARPGEAQYDWEEPRTVDYPVRGRHGCAEEQVRTGRDGAIDAGAGVAESQVGSAASRLSERLAGRHRRAALKALGNSVVPQVVEAIGRVIMQLDAEWR